MAWTMYGKYKKSLFTHDPLVDFDDNVTTTIKLGLVTSLYTPNGDTDEFWSDVEASEVSGTNYPSGGITLSNRIVSDPSANTVTVDADDPPSIAQSGSGFVDARYVVMYKDTGSPLTSPLLAHYDMLEDKDNISSSLTFTLSVNGLWTL